MEDAYGQLVKEINHVDLVLAQAFASVPPERRRIITQHPSLDSFAKRYGLEIVGTIVPSSSAEAADPSARHYSNLLALIKAKGVRTIVTDAGQNDSLARRLAKDADIPDPLPLSFESLAPPGQEGSTWATMMLRNGQLLRKSLLQP